MSQNRQLGQYFLVLLNTVRWGLKSFADVILEKRVRKIYFLCFLEKNLAFFIIAFPIRANRRIPKREYKYQINHICWQMKTETIQKCAIWGQSGGTI